MVTLTASRRTSVAKVAEPPSKHWPELVPSGGSDRVAPEVDPEAKQPNATSQVHDNENAGPRLSFFGKLAKPLVAFHHLLAGPSLSDRDRFNAAAAEARLRVNQGLTSSWWHPR